MASSRMVVAGSLLLLFLTGLLLETEGTPNVAKKTHSDDEISPLNGALLYRGSHSRALLSVKQSCSSKKFYVLKKGDTCQSLLRKYFKGSQTIFRKYNLAMCISAKLFVGGVICLPP
eukprot:TRINITY_DN5369_c0_g2_i3.p1 TRINITY_DN5369_c0_g2~~TRINITY_DN5369_c0_g2_i3.p1  ORF type:complete len:117 (+),score=8.48 TRINITY_DN5369_c0_g2_i3:376-726(+)